MKTIANMLFKTFIISENYVKNKISYILNKFHIKYLIYILLNKIFKDVGLLSAMESSSLMIITNDITNDQDPWSLADASEGIEDNQENQDEEKYKNGWYFLYYV